MKKNYVLNFIAFFLFSTFSYGQLNLTSTIYGVTTNINFSEAPEKNKKNTQNNNSLREEIFGFHKKERIQFKAYPNPAVDYVSLEIPNKLNKATVEIYDISGRLMLKQFITPHDNIIHIEALKKGLHIIKLRTNEKTGVLELLKN